MVSQNYPIALVGFFAGHWSNVDGVQLIKALRNGPRSSRSNILSFAVAELYARIVAIHMGIGHADAPWSSSFYIFSSIPWLPLVDLSCSVSSSFVGVTLALPLGFACVRVHLFVLRNYVVKH